MPLQNAPSAERRPWLPAAFACVAASVICCAAAGCGGPDEPQNQVPENPAPLPDPSERIEG
ncbi:hypothetical protein Pla175_28080 [Pirellulimonas nuda]|uniref:Uncharacterized protein n=1 Tax=Pirellulimonas nuda TaxID=2528009 RepID=A0A518DD67_9BACT|nr:hypothetical protein [Pirellulimonas nuda]QDU89418.1 hypothetical protein Pla175_28080 [Pirellulimonas nuda]